VYRLGYADSRAQARQLVNHGHIAINGKTTDIPSALVKAGDVVSVVSGSADKTYFKARRNTLEQRRSPDWMQRDDANLSARIVTAPARNQIDTSLNEQLIVEYYSR